MKRLKSKDESNIFFTRKS